MRNMLLGVLLVTSAAANAGSGYICPIDNFPMNWTGKVDTSSGKLLKEYKCVSGHVSWGL